MTMKWLTILQFLEIVFQLFINIFTANYKHTSPEAVPPFFCCGTADRIFFCGKFLYHLSGISAAVSSYQQSCDTDGRHRGAVSSGVDLEKKK